MWQFFPHISVCFTAAQKQITKCVRKGHIFHIYFDGNLKRKIQKHRASRPRPLDTRTTRCCVWPFTLIRATHFALYLYTLFFFILIYIIYDQQQKSHTAYARAFFPYFFFIKNLFIIYDFLNCQTPQQMRRKLYEFVRLNFGLIYMLARAVKRAYWLHCLMSS